MQIDKGPMAVLAGLWGVQARGLLPHDLDLRVLDGDPLSEHGQIVMRSQHIETARLAIPALQRWLANESNSEVLGGLSPSAKTEESPEPPLDVGDAGLAEALGELAEFLDAAARAGEVVIVFAG
jgi:hypothetical protein